jgi:hypothetical protein
LTVEKPCGKKYEQRERQYGDMSTVKQKDGVLSPVTRLDHLAFLSSHLCDRSRQPFANADQSALYLLCDALHCGRAGRLTWLVESSIQIKAFFRNSYQGKKTTQKDQESDRN